MLGGGGGDYMFMWGGRGERESGGELCWGGKGEIEGKWREGGIMLGGRGGKGMWGG